MRIAFLDLSKTSTGWANWAPGDAIAASGTWELGSSLTSRGRVFAKLHENMMALEQLGHVDAWFYEEPIHPAQLQGQTNAETVKLAAGLAAHVESAAEAFGARIIRAVNMSTWRREFLGKMPRAMKTADLKDMAMQRCRQLGFKPLKHDQAEALGGLTYACLSLDITPYWIAQEVLRPALGGAGVIRKEIIGNATLYLGDCREILPTLPKVDAVVTDPPYGIGESAAKNRSRNNAAVAADHGDDAWDREPCPPEVIAWMRANSRWQIIFGGNYFELPPTSCWLVWDKQNTGDFADAELAWTNLPKAVRLIHHLWNGMIRKGREERFHLTQKPLDVMTWCLAHLPPVETVLDPFMGSGTTGVAAVQMQRDFIGIEREPKYFDIACRRIEDAQRQGHLFGAAA